jgi:hypothetical protein
MRVKKQICLNCKNEYIAKHPSSKYCGNSCRQYHFREKNGLTPNWGEKTYEKRITLGSIEPAIASVKPIPAQEKTKKVAKKREVTTVINNPEYLRVEGIVKQYANQYELIKTEKENLIKKFNAEVNSNPQAQFWVGGAIGGAAIGLAVGKEKGASSLAGALFGLLGGFIAADAAKDDLEKAKVKRLNKLRADIQEKENQLTQIQIYYHDFKFRLQKITKSIPKTIEETYYEDVPHEDVTNNPVELPKVAVKKPEIVFAGKATNNQANEPTNAPIGLSDLKNMKFEILPFTGQYQTLIGSPEENFNMLVYGSPGHGKSTFCADFATYLANNHGTVLYCASEEGLSLSLQKKFLDKNSSYIFFDASKSYEDLKSKIGQKGKYRFVVIDSINDINISPEQLRELRSIDKKRGFICIMQANKDGSYKGNNTYSHDADIKIRLENYVPFVEKSRFK